MLLLVYNKCSCAVGSQKLSIGPPTGSSPLLALPSNLFQHPINSASRHSSSLFVPVGGSSAVFGGLHRNKLLANELSCMHLRIRTTPTPTPTYDKQLSAFYQPGLNPCASANDGAPNLRGDQYRRV
jgi:hypothetical protein